MPVAVDVITVCYQSAATLERCIDSVRRSKQAIANYIIIDGGSTDGTLEIIQKHQDFIDHWVSENDDGIADAFNKGISIAVSPYILLLNSDDYLLDGALERVVSQILPDDQIIMTPVSWNIQGIEIETKTSNPARIRHHSSVLHPGTLIHRNVYQAVGGYDSTYKIAMDYDFFARCVLHNCQFRLIEIPLASFSVGNGVSQHKNLELFRETFAVRRKHFHRFVPFHEAKRWIRARIIRLLHRFGLNYGIYKQRQKIGVEN